MEYRGIEYTIVQTANPTGWKWTVHLGKRAKTGTAFNRIAACRFAERTIDAYLKRHAQETHATA
jgi:hypothetical protein